MAFMLAKSSCRVPAFGAPRPCVAPVVQRVSVISYSYQNKENIDLSRVSEVKKNEADVGSCEVQVATLCARITQLTLHMQRNKKDNSAKRGLQQILAQRKKLLKYLYSTNKLSYDDLLARYGIRSITGDARPAKSLNKKK
eukprot:gene8356-3435_t